MRSVSIIHSPSAVTTLIMTVPHAENATAVSSAKKDLQKPAFPIRQNTGIKAMPDNYIQPLIKIIDFLFPSRCVNCNQPISITSNCLCDRCFNNIPAIENKCEICSGSLTDGKCIICSDREFYIKKNITVAEYTGTIKNILHCYTQNMELR